MSEPIESLLKSDFETARAMLEADGFKERLLSRLRIRRNARFAVLAGAGGVGAVIAGAQFASVTGSLEVSSPYVRELSALAQQAGFSTAFAPAMLASFAIALGFMATALVLRAEN